MDVQAEYVAWRQNRVRDFELVCDCTPATFKEMLPGLCAQ